MLICSLYIGKRDLQDIIEFLLTFLSCLLLLDQVLSPIPPLLLVITLVLHHLGVFISLEVVVNEIGTNFSDVIENILMLRNCSHNTF